MSLPVYMECHMTSLGLILEFFNLRKEVMPTKTAQHLVLIASGNIQEKNLVQNFRNHTIILELSIDPIMSCTHVLPKLHSQADKI